MSNCSAGKYHEDFKNLSGQTNKEHLHHMIFFADLSAVGRFGIAETWQGGFPHLFPISTKDSSNMKLSISKKGDLFHNIF